MNSNAFFIGKSILNHTYHSKRSKTYQNKMEYSINELFQYLNLSEKDINAGNSAHKRKAIFKALDQLEEKGIIKIDKMNTERIILKEVWTIADIMGEKARVKETLNPGSSIIPMDGCARMMEEHREGKDCTYESSKF
jgi:hypothetical protein